MDAWQQESTSLRYLFFYVSEKTIKVAFVRLVFSRSKELIIFKVTCSRKIDNIKLLFSIVHGADENIVPVKVSMSKVMFFKRISYVLKLGNVFFGESVGTSQNVVQRSCVFDKRCYQKFKNLIGFTQYGLTEDASRPFSYSVRSQEVQGL